MTREAGGGRREATGSWGEDPASTAVARPASIRPQAGTRPPPASLVIQTSFLGDVVLTTPLIAELATRGPVDVVVTPAAAPLLSNDPAIRRLIVYDKRTRDAGPAGLWRLARTLRRGVGGPDGAERDAHAAPRTAYLAQGSVRSAMLAMLAGARERVGFAGASGSALYTRRVARRDYRHHAERLWALAFPDESDARPTADALQPRLYPRAADVGAVDALLAGWPADEPFVALAPGSVWATKRWPYYAELARRLAPRVRLVVIGGRGDTSHAREIAAAAAPHDVVDATGALSLLGSAELIRRAALLVTNDSSPQHLASAMRTRTLTLYGPTTPSLGFGPLAPNSVALGHDALACRPCHHHGPPACPLGHWRCMRELDPAQVAQSVIAMLES